MASAGLILRRANSEQQQGNAMEAYHTGGALCSEACKEPTSHVLIDRTSLSAGNLGGSNLQSLGEMPSPTQDSPSSAVDTKRDNFCEATSPRMPFKEPLVAGRFHRESTVGPISADKLFFERSMLLEGSIAAEAPASGVEVDCSSPGGVRNLKRQRCFEDDLKLEAQFGASPSPAVVEVARKGKRTRVGKAKCFSPNTVLPSPDLSGGEPFQSPASPPQATEQLKQVQGLPGAVTQSLDTTFGLGSFKPGDLVWGKSGQRKDPFWPAKVIDPLMEAPPRVRGSSQPNSLCVMYFGPAASKKGGRDYSWVKEGSILPFLDYLARLQQQKMAKARQRDFWSAVKEALLVDAGLADEGLPRPLQRWRADLAAQEEVEEEAAEEEQEGVCISCRDPLKPSASNKKVAPGTEGLCRNCLKLFKAGQYCPVCRRVWLPNDDGFVQCDGCDMWIHTDCDNIDATHLQAMQAADEKYFCPLCRKKQRGAAERPGTAKAPAKVAVRCCGVLGDYLPREHKVVCKCWECRGRRWELPQFEQHAGAASKRWRHNVTLADAKVTLGSWLNGLYEKGVMGLGAYGKIEVCVPSEMVPYLDAPKSEPVEVKWAGEQCAVCFLEEDWPWDKMITCDRCRVFVHELCYGASAGEDGSFVCCACEVPGVERQCCLCPVKGGALKPTTLRGKWAHVACGQWVEETKIPDEHCMEPIAGVEDIPIDRWKLTCSICQQRGGACIQCSFKLTGAKRKRVPGLFTAPSVSSSQPPPSSEGTLVTSDEQTRSLLTLRPCPSQCAGKPVPKDSGGIVGDGEDGATGCGIEGSGGGEGEMEGAEGLSDSGVEPKGGKRRRKSKARKSKEDNNCFVAFHLLCARLAGYHLERVSGEDLMILHSYCPKHGQVRPSKGCVSATVGGRPLYQQAGRQTAAPGAAVTTPPEDSRAPSPAAAPAEDVGIAARCLPYVPRSQRPPPQHGVEAVAVPYWVEGVRRHPKEAVCMLQAECRTVDVSTSGEQSIVPRDSVNAQRLPVSERVALMKRTESARLCLGKSSIHGWGLIARTNISEGDMVLDYRGELVGSAMANLREKRYQAQGKGCYLFKIDDQQFVDATEAGNLARLINHSCGPNCWAKIMEVDGKNEVILFAKRDLKAGEELTYDYRFDSEERDKVPCSCGASNCRGYMN